MASVGVLQCEEAFDKRLSISTIFLIIKFLVHIPGRQTTYCIFSSAVCEKGNNSGVCQILLLDVKYVEKEKNSSFFAFLFLFIFAQNRDAFDFLFTVFDQEEKRRKLTCN